MPMPKTAFPPENGAASVGVPASKTGWNVPGTGVAVQSATLAVKRSWHVEPANAARGQIRARLPIVLNVEAEVGVGIERHDGRTGRRGALECNRDWDIQIIYHTVLVTITIRNSDWWVRCLANAATEIRACESTAAPEKIEERVGIQVLILAAEAQGVIPD